MLPDPRKVVRGSSGSYLRKVDPPTVRGAPSSHRSNQSPWPMPLARAKRCEAKSRKMVVFMVVCMEVCAADFVSFENVSLLPLFSGQPMLVPCSSARQMTLSRCIPPSNLHIKYRCVICFSISRLVYGSFIHRDFESWQPVVSWSVVGFWDIKCRFGRVEVGSRR